MSPDGTDDSFVELADEEAKRTERRGWSDPRLRFIVLIAGILVVVLVAGILIRNAIRSSEAAGYKSYIETVATIIKASDKVGAGLTSLLLKPGNTTRKDVQAKLDQYIQTSDQLNQQAKDMKAPSALKEAHQWFAATMQLRARGLTNLKPSLMNALEVQDIEVSSDQVTRAMQLLMLSDVAYQEFFVERATTVLSEKRISGVTVPTTDFLTDTTLASKAKVKDVLTALKSSGGLQAIHGVTLLKVVASPANVEIKAGGTYNLVSDEKLSFKITVENSGNMTETDVPVTFRLQAPSSAQPQLKTEKIAEIKAGAKVDVVITGISPTPYGETALIRVEAGPVPNEKIIDNNTLEAHVIFTL
jgi:hypothetical protein